MIHHEFRHGPLGVTRMSTAKAVMYPSPKVGGGLGCRSALAGPMLSTSAVTIFYLVGGASILIWAPTFPI